MNKTLKVILLALLSFVSTIINNALWLILAYNVNMIVPARTEIFFTALVTIFCLAFHVIVYIVLYRRCYKNTLNIPVYIAICALPYVVLLCLIIVWLMTFPFL